MKKVSSFIYVPLQDQLIELLQILDIVTKIDHRFTRIKRNKNNYEDIDDGEMCRQIWDGKSLSDQGTLSISFNYDGVPVFQLSNLRILPLGAILNEFSTKERVENIFLLGHSLGNTKPVMTTFLHPFTEEINSASVNWN